MGIGCTFAHCLCRPRGRPKGMCPLKCVIYFCSYKIQNDENGIFRHFVWKFDKTVTFSLIFQRNVSRRIITITYQTRYAMLRECVHKKKKLAQNSYFQKAVKRMANCITQCQRFKPVSIRETK